MTDTTIAKTAGAAVRCPTRSIPNAVTIVAELDGVQIGEAAIERKSANIYLVTNLYVEPEFRRRGVGRLLVTACQEYARQHGAAEIRTMVAEGDWGARAFCGACGWRR